MPRTQQPDKDSQGAEVFASLTAELADVMYIVRVEPDLAFEYVSPSVQALVGYSPEEHYADPQLGRQIVDPRDVDMLHTMLTTPVGEVSDVVIRWRAKHGGTVWTNHRGRKEQRSDGSVVVYAVARDVKGQVERERALAAREERLRLMLDNVTDIVFDFAPDRTIRWVSSSVQRVLGWDPADLVGQPAVAFIPLDDLARRQSASQAVNAGQRGEDEARLRTADGGYRWMAVTIRPVFDSHGEVVGRIGNARDIQAEVDTRQDLARSEQRLRLAMESAPVGMAVADLDRRFLEVNPALCRMLDRDESWLLTHRFPDVLEGSFDQLDLQIRGQVLSGRSTTASHEAVLVRADGSTVWVEHSIGLLRDDDGVPQAYVCQFVDITEAKHGRDRLEDRANHDPLTQLLTRTALLQAIERIESHPPRKGTHLGALFIDIDRFKQTNDRHGHLAGDQVLVAVGERATANVRGDDLVARLGGDEIVVVLPTVDDAAGAAAVAAKIQASLAEPVLVDGEPIHVTVSIGVAVAQPDEDAEQVIARADRALYRAKRSGRDRTVADG